ncbi:porin [Camelimonas abortus]|uniref:Porin n=1 Tax=Camelimonas abortus TaxID=1017184 RepID=A0ABV7LC60_9HYPH
MSKIRAFLLGSAATFGAASGALAADLPASKAAPVEHVKVCSAQGAGFFYIPGTDTCIRIGGRARFEYNLSGPLKVGNPDRSSFRGLGRLQVDARTNTEWGVLRTFVSFEIASRTGGWSLRSGTAERMAQAFGATGVDTFNRAQKSVEADKAFIQFAGLTAGRFGSFFDFYGHTLELIGATSSSDVLSTNGLAYTAKLGNGFTATVSMEDPTFRRTPVYYSGNTGPVVVGGKYYGNVGVTFDPATGLPLSYASVDVAQRLNTPDFILALRQDGDWGSAQLSAALHQISVGNYVSTGDAGTYIAPKRPDAAWGYAVQGGVKVNLPFLAKGDQLWLQGAWGRGAMAYTGATAMFGGDSLTGQSFGRFTVNTVDAYVNAYGDLKLGQSWSVLGAFLHYWTPTVRQAVFASYSKIEYGSGARGALGPLYAGVGGSLIPAGLQFSPQQAVTYAESAVLRDSGLLIAGTNLVWSPVKGLDIGAEVAFAQVRVDGRVKDANKNISYRVNGVTYARTASTDYAWQGRLRIQRDF